MANKTHLKMILQGVNAWNAWRFQNRREKPRLIRAKLSGRDLRRINLSDAILKSADLSGVDLSHSFLDGAFLSDADLKGANLNYTVLRSARIVRADLSSANLNRADLTEANLLSANLQGALFNEATLRQTVLRNAKLGEAQFSGARLQGAQLQHADLRYACFAGADLSGANLRGANLRGTNLSWSYLIGADMTGTTLSDANLNQAIIGGTSFGETDLSTVKGLDNVTHLGPSSIGIDALFKSDGKIPDVFLRGTGVPDDFITFVPSLVGRAIEFYSCFISYSQRDEEFSRRLHSRMRSENLRVWFAPEDIKAGRKIHEEVFRAIQIHDKLLLVLSENSMRSKWVKTEILRARKVEQNEDRRKLFPIRLVDFEAIRKWECFDADSGEDLAVELRKYYIPNFSNWKDHNAFETEFAKLLRDLKATDS